MLRQTGRTKRTRKTNQRRTATISHLHDLIDLEHKQLTPIKEAISKYREIQDISNSDRWIRESIKYGIGNVLMIQKVK